MENNSSLENIYSQNILIIDKLETNSKEDLVPIALKRDLLDLNFNIQLLSAQIMDSLINSNYLLWSSNQLSLRLASQKQLKVDFAEPQYSRKINPRSDLLCRACGWHLGLRKLWDLTAGLGVDTIHLWRAGFYIKSFERNPYLWILLRQAFRELSESIKGKDQMDLTMYSQIGDQEKLDFIYSDSEKILNQLQVDSKQNLPEVIYYDPMYPPSKKSALPSKEIQMLRELNGVNEESKSLVEKAKDLGVRRVVVKRPHRAPPVIAHPQAQIEGKLLRFDIY